MDTIIQALSGLMMTSGRPGDPPVRVGVPVADMVAPIFGVMGVLAALQQRTRTGVGQQVDISMLGALTSLVAAEPFELLEACGVPQRTDRMVPRLAPFGVYRSRDGFVAICAPTETFARGAVHGDGRAGTRRRCPIRDARRARGERGRHERLVETFTSASTSGELVSLLERPAFRRQRSGLAARGRTRLAGSRARRDRAARASDSWRVADMVGNGSADRLLRRERPRSTARARAWVNTTTLVYGQCSATPPERLRALRAAGVI